MISHTGDLAPQPGDRGANVVGRAVGLVGELDEERRPVLPGQLDLFLQLVEALRRPPAVQADVRQADEHLPGRIGPAAVRFALGQRDHARVLRRDAEMPADGAEAAALVQHLGAERVPAHARRGPGEALPGRLAIAQRQVEAALGDDRAEGVLHPPGDRDLLDLPRGRANLEIDRHRPQVVGDRIGQRRRQARGQSQQQGAPLDDPLACRVEELRLHAQHARRGVVLRVVHALRVLHVGRGGPEAVVRIDAQHRIARVNAPRIGPLELAFALGHRGQTGIEPGHQPGVAPGHGVEIPLRVDRDRVQRLAAVVVAGVGAGAEDLQQFALRAELVDLVHRGQEIDVARADRRPCRRPPPAPGAA